MKIFGALLMIFGFVDLIGSFTQFDLWGQYMGVGLPNFIWKFTAYVELILGYFLLLTGGKITAME
ncbi:hypothetical protein MNBD_GAMMA12-1220 [hydrothermal vent metagenome]|uniref:DoxX family protein n=1 Tax=hydrothermal vent metagenome TaxID=652676 RepID=A0A3B0YW29_9ZZZZ